MTTVIVLIAFWLVCKALRGVFKPRKSGKPETLPSGNNSNMSALIALQQQREQIESTIAYIDDCIGSSENPRETISLFDKKSVMLGKLASVEQRITKLIS